MTAAQYAQDLDREAPLTKQWGGRLLTVEEAKRVTPSTQEIELLEMNLRHLRYEVFECDAGVTVTSEQLGAMMDLAAALESAAEMFKLTAEAIEAHVPELWRQRDEEATDNA